MKCETCMSLAELQLTLRALLEHTVRVIKSNKVWQRAYQTMSNVYRFWSRGINWICTVFFWVDCHMHWCPSWLRARAPCWICNRHLNIPVGKSRPDRQPCPPNEYWHPGTVLHPNIAISRVVFGVWIPQNISNLVMGEKCDFRFSPWIFKCPHWVTVEMEDSLRSSNNVSTDCFLTIYMLDNGALVARVTSKQQPYLPLE